MKPWELAAKWYERFLPQENFANAVAENFRRDNGHVYSCGDIFAMGQEVRWDNEQKQIVAGDPNAWFAELVAVTGIGNPLHRIMSIAPHPHEWCLWQRRNDGRIRAHKWHDLMTKLQGE
jgi:hypothetical protein